MHTLIRASFKSLAFSLADAVGFVCQHHKSALYSSARCVAVAVAVHVCASRGVCKSSSSPNQNWLAALVPLNRCRN